MNAAAAMMLAAAVFIQTGMTTQASDGFVSSTPDYDNDTGLDLSGEKEKLRKAVEEFARLGISPMTIVQRLRQEDAAPGAESSSSATAGRADSSADGTGASSETGETAGPNPVVSMAQDAGSDLVNRAQEAGNGVIQGAQQEVQKQKENFLEKLRDNIKEAVGNFVDGLFSRL